MNVNLFIGFLTLDISSGNSHLYTAERSLVKGYILFLRIENHMYVSDSFFPDFHRVFAEFYQIDSVS